MAVQIGLLLLIMAFCCPFQGCCNSATVLIQQTVASGLSNSAWSAVLDASRTSVFIADQGHCAVVRVMVTNPYTMTTYAGTRNCGGIVDGDATTVAQFGGVVGLVVWDADRLYVSDYTNGAIRLVRGSIVSTVVTTIPQAAVMARFGSDAIVVATGTGSTIRMLTISKASVSIIATLPTIAQGIATDATFIYAASGTTSDIYRLTSSGSVSTLATIGGGGHGGLALLPFPTDEILVVGSWFNGGPLYLTSTSSRSTLSGLVVGSNLGHVSGIAPLTPSIWFALLTSGLVVKLVVDMPHKDTSKSVSPSVTITTALSGGASRSTSSSITWVVSGTRSPSTGSSTASTVSVASDSNAETSITCSNTSPLHSRTASASLTMSAVPHWTQTSSMISQTLSKSMSPIHSPSFSERPQSSSLSANVTQTQIGSTPSSRSTSFSSTPTPSPTLAACDPLLHCQLSAHRFAVPSVIDDSLYLLGRGVSANRWTMSPISAADVRRTLLRSPMSGNLTGASRAIFMSVVCGSFADEPFHSVVVGVPAVNTATVALEGAFGGPWASAPFNTTAETDGVDGASATATVRLLGGSTLADSLNRAMSNVPSFWYQSGLHLVIRFGLLCGGVSAPVSVMVPIVADALPASASSAAVVSTAQWTAGLSSGASAAVAVGRVAATRRLVLCGVAASSADGGLLGLRIGGAAAGCEWLPLARGAIVGNAGVVLFGGALVLTLAGCLWSAFHEGASILRRVCLPGSLLGLWTATISTTIGAVTSIVIPPSSVCEFKAADVLAVVVGVASIVIPLVSVVAVGIVGPEAMFGASLRAADIPSQCGEGTLKHLWRVATLRRWRWYPSAPTPQSDRLGCVQRIAAPVLLEYRVVWYAAVDAGGLVILSCISMSGGSLSGGVCRYLGSAVVGIIAAQLALFATIRPVTSHLSYAYGCLTLLLTLVSASTQLFTVTRLSASDTKELNAAMAVAAACDLMGASIGIVRLLLLDLPSALKGAFQLVREICDGLRTCIRGNKPLKMSVDGSPLDEYIPFDPIVADPNMSVTTVPRRDDEPLACNGPSDDNDFRHIVTAVDGLVFAATFDEVEENVDAFGMFRL